MIVLPIRITGVVSGPSGAGRKIVGRLCESSKKFSQTITELAA